MALLVLAAPRTNFLSHEVRARDSANVVLDGAAKSTGISKAGCCGRGSRAARNLPLRTRRQLHLHHYRAAPNATWHEKPPQLFTPSAIEGTLRKAAASEGLFGSVLCPSHIVASSIAGA